MKESKLLYDLTFPPFVKFIEFIIIFAAISRAIAYKTKANLDSNTNNSRIFSVLISREARCFPPLLIKQKAHVSFSQPSYCWTVVRAVMFSFLC